MTTDQRRGSSGHDRYTLPTAALSELADGLELLCRAYNYGRDANADQWQFAVEIQQFYDMGLTNNELRWLIAKGLADHARESSTCGDTRRSFELTGGLTFSETSAFVLTETGVAFASEVYATVPETAEAALKQNLPWAGEAASESSAGHAAVHLQAALKPTWDSHRRELRVGGTVVKQFRVPAASQEAVLAAFQEESWPDYIDDPLPCVGDSVPKQRLHNAIKRLNDNQANHLIRFHGNGRGEGIGWKLIVTFGRSV